MTQTAVILSAHPASCQARANSVDSGHAEQAPKPPAAITYVIVDLPDNEAVAALALTVNAAGGATVKTTVLLTPEQVDEAAKRSVDYRPPGTDPCRAQTATAGSRAPRSLTSPI